MTCSHMPIPNFRTFIIHEVSDFTPAEFSLTGKDQAVGIPTEASKACKTALFDRSTEIGSLISGTYIRALLIPHVACRISEMPLLDFQERYANTCKQSKFIVRENTLPM